MGGFGASLTASRESSELARLAALLSRRARFHEGVKICAVDEKRSPRIRRLESGRDPSRDRVLVRPDAGAQLADRAALMEFDAAAVEPLRRGLLRRLDELADALDLPRSRARPELYRLGEPPSLDARPPRRATDRDRPLRREN